MACPIDHIHFVTGEDIVPIRSKPIFSTLIVDGCAARYKVLENGGRVIADDDTRDRHHDQKDLRQRSCDNSTRPRSTRFRLSSRA